MPKRQTGDFCWVELCTTDSAKAFDFYHPIFNWGKITHDNGDFGEYHMLTLNEQEIAGAFQLTDDMKKQGAVPCWNAYVKVDDVDATANKAKSLGGKILNGPFDVMEYGRMAVLEDPTGAVVCLWHTDKNSETPEKTQPGNYGWIELLTTDTQKAETFYKTLFDWTAETAQFGDHDYTSFSINGEPIAGMMKIKSEWGHVPPNWNVYFTVNNLDESLEIAKKNGAELCCDVMEIPEVGRFTTLKDPQGVYVSMIQYPKSE